MTRREVDATYVTVTEKLYAYNGNVPGVNLKNRFICGTWMEKLLSRMPEDSFGAKRPRKPG